VFRQLLFHNILFAVIVIIVIIIIINMHLLFKLMIVYNIVPTLLIIEIN
jgi:hypothetical protein